MKRAHARCSAQQVPLGPRGSGALVCLAASVLLGAATTLAQPIDPDREGAAGEQPDLSFPGRGAAAWRATAGPYAAGQTDPMNPDYRELPVMGRMIGALPCSSGVWQEFGRSVWPVGDIDHSGLPSWIIQRQRCDTLFGDVYHKAPIELLLYRGVRGGLPSVESGERIGPRELGSQCTFLASGDWDGDSHLDLAISQLLIDDTTQGLQGGPVRRLVVFWGNADGRFSVDDSSHLVFVSDVIGVLVEALSFDADADGVHDLLVAGKGSWVDGKPIYTPLIHIFRGHRGRRWQRHGTPGRPDWQWWAPPSSSRMVAVDHDRDGAMDVALLFHSQHEARVTVLYGRRGVLPDTAEVESVSLRPANGMTSCLADVTGDSVPELAIACGSEEVMRVYVGIRGQRLSEQFGSGMDPPDPGSPERWWGRPWAEIWLPKKLDASWPMAGFQVVTNLGDVGLDGIGDLALFVFGRLIFYSGGAALDDYVDALVRLPSEFLQSAVVLGDIDGSGVATIALGYAWDPGAVLYVKPDWRVPETGVERRRPPGTDTVAASVSESSASTTLRLLARPNPATGLLHLSWESASGKASILLCDLLGRPMRASPILPGASELTLDVRDLPPGAYLVTLTNGTRRQSHLVWLR